MYLLAASYFGPASLTGFELDAAARAIALANLEGAGVEADVQLKDLLTISED